MWGIMLLPEMWDTVNGTLLLLEMWDTVILLEIWDTVILPEMWDTVILLEMWDTVFLLEMWDTVTLLKMWDTVILPEMWETSDPLVGVCCGVASSTGAVGSVIVSHLTAIGKTVWTLNVENKVLSTIWHIYYCFNTNWLEITCMYLLFNFAYL